MADDRIELVALKGPYKGQKLKYARGVAERLLATGGARYPDAPAPPAKRAEHAVRPEPEKRTEPPVMKTEDFTPPAPPKPRRKQAKKKKGRKT